MISIITKYGPQVVLILLALAALPYILAIAILILAARGLAAIYSK
jgi:hypothetical protein